VPLPNRLRSRAACALLRFLILDADSPPPREILRVCDSEFHHGIMSVIDRKGLEAASCECYHAIQDEFDRLLGG
jgi:hypothetical protein